MRISHPNNQVKFGYSPAVTDLIKNTQKTLSKSDPDSFIYDIQDFVRVNKQNRTILEEAKAAFGDKTVIENVKGGLQKMYVVAQAMINNALK